MNNSQCQSSCRKISFKLFQRDKSFMDSFKGPAPKFCIYSSFSKLPPLCSPSPLGEAEGGRESGQKLLSPFGPTNDFILWRWQLFRICLQSDFSIYQPSLIGKVVQQDLRLVQLPCSYKPCFAMIFIWVIMCKQNYKCSIYILMCPSMERTTTTFINAFLLHFLSLNPCRWPILYKLRTFHSISISMYEIVFVWYSLFWLYYM